MRVSNSRKKYPGPLQAYPGTNTCYPGTNLIKNDSWIDDNYIKEKQESSNLGEKLIVLTALFSSTNFNEDFFYNIQGDIFCAKKHINESKLLGQIQFAMKSLPLVLFQT